MNKRELKIKVVFPSMSPKYGALDQTWSYKPTYHKFNSRVGLEDSLFAKGFN